MSVDLQRPTAGVEVGGVITQSTTWGQSGSPYVVTEDVTVQNGVVLTVEAGVEVRFVSGSGLFVHGALRAVGTPAEPITFTTNAVTPAAGQWEGLFFEADSDDALTQLRYVSVTYAGQQVLWYGQYHRTGIGVYDASPVIEHTTVRHSYGQGLKAIEASLVLSHDIFENNGWSGLYLQDTDLTLSDSSLSHNGYEGLWWYNWDAAALAPTLTGNTISDNNQEGVEVYAYVPIDLTLTGNTINENGLHGMVIRAEGVEVAPMLTGNTILSNTWNAVLMAYNGGAGLPVASGNTAYGNGRLNGVAVQGTLALSSTWPAIYDLPLGTDADLTVNQNVELTVEPNAEIWFGSWSNLNVHGALRAVGTPAAPITLTTYASYWGGLVYYDDSDDARNQLDYVTLIRAGSDYYDAGIDVTAAAPTIQHTTVRDGYGYGLRARDTSLTVNDSTFEENGRSGAYSDNAQLTLDNCTLRLNDDHGLEVYASGTEAAPTLTGSAILSNTEYAVNVVYAEGGGLPVLAGNTVAGNGDGNVVAVRGTLGYSLTWAAGYELPLRVEGDLTVQNGVELTVEPGVETTFDRYAGLVVHGALRAVGTPASPITFTSSSPPSVYWDGLFFDEDSDDARTLLEYVRVTYAGYATYWHSAPGTGIGVYQASPTIRHTAVQYSNGHGLWAADASLALDQDTFAENKGSGIMVNNTTLTLTATSAISNWDYAILVRDLIDVGLPDITGGTFAGNVDFDGVVVDGSLGYSMTWPMHYALPLAVGGDSTVHGLTVASGVELTLDPGTEMLFTTSDAGLYVHGALRALGTASQPITFTSILDAPGTGEWEGIYFEADSDDARSLLEYAVVSYAGEWVSNWNGDTWYTGIGAFEASPTIRHTTVRQSHGYGVRMENTGLTLDQNTLSENERSGVLVVNGALTVTQSAITDNGEFAVMVDGVNRSGLPIITDSTIAGNQELDGVAVAGTLTYTMTWPTNYNLPLLVPYSFEVSNGVQLDVEPGTEMRFGPAGGLFVHGALRAVGTPADPITFTAHTITPTIDYWRGIFFEEDSDDAENLLEHVVVRYAGRYFSWRTSVQTLIGVHNASPTFRRSTLEQSAGDGLLVFTTEARAAPVLDENIVISNTNYAIRVDYGFGGGGLPVLLNNVVVGNGGHDGVGVEGRIAFPEAWPADYPLPLRVVGDLTVETGAELLVEPGQRITFDANAGLYVDGTLRAEGRPPLRSSSPRPRPPPPRATGTGSF